MLDESQSVRRGAACGRANIPIITGEVVAHMKYEDFMKSVGLSDVELNTNVMMASMISDIIKRRRVLGLTQGDVAERAGITQAQVARLENSSHVPRLDTLLKVVYILGMNISINEALDEQSAARGQLLALP